MRRISILCLSPFLFVGCGDDETKRDPSDGDNAIAESPDRESAGFQFADVSAEIGLEWKHDKAPSEKKHLPETMAGGGGFLDFDGDGRLDIYLVQSANFPGRQNTGKGNVLLRQNEDGTLSDVTETSGVGDRGFGMGVQSADLDNDGDTEIFVTNFGKNTLYRNEGDGTFSDVTDEAHVGDPRWSMSSAFLDGNGDGFLDLYVANYLAYDPSTAPECTSAGASVSSYCSPTQFVGEDDILYSNDGHGVFSDVSEKAGILGFKGKGLGVSSADLDEDGDIDILVANDTTPTLLFRNRGNLEFDERGIQAGIALSEDGVARAGMGIDIADVNSDGLTDVFLTNFTAEVNGLYLGGPDGSFVEASRPSGLGSPSYPFLGFGAVFLDADADGDRDVAVVNGHVLDTVELSNQATTYRQRPFLFRNDDTGLFGEVGRQSGSSFHRRYAGRGLSSGDYDNDGDEDLLMIQVDGRPLLLRNDTPRMGSVILLRLVGGKSNRDAIGARIEVHVANRTLRFHVLGARSYLSVHDRRLVMGLGDAERVERLVIHWPSGFTETLNDLEVNVAITVEEGQGVILSEALPPPSEE